MQSPYITQVADNNNVRILVPDIVLTGNISFGSSTNTKDISQNIRGVWVKFTVTAANTSQTVNLPYTVGNTPIGYIVMLKSAACDIYSSTTDQSNWTSSKIVVEGTVAGVSVTLFVIF